MVASRPASGGPDSPGAARPLVHGLADEMSPCLLPGGRELVYVSNQGGDRNIWRRRLPRGWARRLTRHSADDFDPAVKADGSGLVFVSTRRDAKGDLYLLSLAKPGQPRRLTGVEHGEREPDWFPDGQRLAYVRTSHGASDGIFLLNLKDGSSRRLSARPGHQPAVSPDGSLLVFVAASAERHAGRPCLWLQRFSDGREWPLGECTAPVGFPAWMRLQEQYWLVYSRFADDSNADGRLDTADRPSLWMAPLLLDDGQRPRLGRALPLTPGLAADIQPRVLGRRLVFASRSDGDLDIWGLEVELPSSGDCSRAGVLAEKAGRQQEALWYIRRAGFRATGLRWQQCQLLEAGHLQRWGRHRQAGELFSALALQARDEAVRRQALIGQVAAAMQQRLPLGLSPARRQEARPVARQLLQALDDIGIEAREKLLVRADICRRVGWFTRALHLLDELVAASNGTRRARALQMQAHILLRLGQREGAVERLLRVAADEQVQPALRRTAARKLIAVVSDTPGDSSSDRGARLELLAARNGGAQPAATMIRLAIARWHRQQGHLQLARQSLRLAERLSAAVPRLAGQALLELSRLAEQQGRLAEAADHVAEMLERFAGDARTRLLARRRLKRLTLHHARLLAAAGETTMAAKALERLLRQEPEDVAAWREWLALMNRSGRSRSAWRRVQRWQRQQQVDDALGRYLLGLAYTYLDPPGNFSRARRCLEKSLLLDPQSPYPHQTLGWLEEQTARLDDDPGHLLAAAEQYEAALDLMTGAGLRRERADLLLNLGNVYLALGNGDQAWRLYRQRQQCGEPFRRPERKLAFLENLARTAFLSDHLEQAATTWQQAFELSRRLGRERRLPRLLAAQAAARQVAGQHRQAAEVFARACRLYGQAGRVAERARCLRSLGYNQFLAGDARQASSSLLEARRLFQSLPGDRPGANPQIAVSLSGGGSRAPLGFSTGQELDLIDTLLAQLSARSGDGPRALASLQAKLERLQQRRRDLDDDRLWLDISLTQSQLAAGWLENGRPGRAVRLWRESADSAARVGRADGQALAALNLLEVARSGWVQVSPARLVEYLQRARAAVLQSATPRPELVARVAAGLAVELARQAGQRPATKAGKTRAERRLRQVLAGLDSELVLLHRALEAARLSVSMAGRVAGVRGARLQAMAAWNLSVLLRRLGREREAESWYRRVQAGLRRPELADLEWRLPGPGTSPRERLKRLLATSPARAATAGSAEARRQQDRLMAQLVEEAAGGGDAGQLLAYLDVWIRLRRRDRLWPDRDKLQPDFVKRLAERLDAQPLAAGTVAGLLPPGWGLLAGVALEQETILVWMSSGRVRVVHRPLGRGEVSRLVAALSGGNGQVAERARQRLGRLLVQPLAALLAEAKGVVLVDGLLDVPWEALPFQDRPLLAHLPLCRVGAVADISGWRRAVNVNFGGALWVGRPPGADLRGQAASLFGVVRRLEPEAVGQERSAGSGLVVWAVGWTADGQRPLRSTLAPHPRLGAVAGLKVHQLGRQEQGAGLWVLAPGRRPGLPGRLAAGIDVAALQARVPRVLLLPAGPPGQFMLRGALQHLAGQSLAQSLARTVRDAGQALPWQALLELQLRGHPGLDRRQRVEYARSHLAGAVTAAMNAYKQGRLARALERFFSLRTLAAYLGRDDILAAADGGIVQCAFRLERFELARQAQQRLLAAARARSDELAEAQAARLLGIITSRLGGHRQAHRLLQRALELFDGLGRQRLAAGCAATLALARDAAADYQGAIAAARSALERFAKLGNRAQQARMMRLLGTSYLRRLHRLERARRWYREALHIYRQLPDEASADAVQLDLARTELTAGNYDLVLEIAREVASRAGRRGDLARQAEARLEEAKACWYRGDYQRARLARQRSVEVASRAGNTRLKISAISLGGLILMSLGRLADAEEQLRRALQESRRAGLEDEQAAQLNNLGLVLRRRGRLRQALELHQQARRLDERLKNQAGLAYDLRNTGLVLLGLGRLEEALDNLSRAVRLSTRLHDQFNRAQSLCGLARAEQAAGRLDDARQQARAALQAADQQGLQEVVWQAEQILGDLARARGDTGGAWEHYRRAIGVVERLPAGAARARQGGFTIGDSVRLFEDAVHLLLDMQRPARAFVYAERARVKELADVLVRAPRWRDTVVPGRVVEVARWRRDLPDDTAVLAFFVTAGDTVMWLLERGRLQVKRVQLPAGRLAEMVDDLRRALANHAPAASYLQQLHRLLLEPWREQLAGTANLLVIPHGPLAGVPFAALREPAGRYLYERLNVFRCQSATLFRLLQQRRQLQLQPPGPALVVAGVPAEQLPFARLEVESVLDRLPATALLDRQATRSELLRLAPRAGFIHLVGHGGQAAGSPLDRGLSLGAGQQLHLLDVLGLDLAARLVVLSGCYTAVAAGGANTPRIDLALAFLLAGAEQALGSLWPVSDVAAAVLMKRFYRQLAKVGPARALRRARDVVRRYFPHPGYWAAYTLVGSGNPR